MKKTLKIIGVVLVALIIIVVAGLLLAGGPIIKSVVNTVGPKVLGVPVTLQHATFRPFHGAIRLTQLHIGNPEGFKTPGLFELGDVEIALDVRSLFSDTLVIHKIAVNAPAITYERGLRNSNFGKLIGQLRSGAPKTDAKPKTAGAEQGGGKKVIIEQLLIRDPQLNVSVTAAGGRFMPVALGQVELKDIGKEHGGVTPVDALQIIFSVITSNIENAARGAGTLLDSGVKAVGAGAQEVGDAVAEGAATAIKDVGQFIGIGVKQETPAEK